MPFLGRGRSRYDMIYRVIAVKHGSSESLFIERYLTVPPAYNSVIFNQALILTRCEREIKMQKLGEIFFKE